MFLLKMQRIEDEVPEEKVNPKDAILKTEFKRLNLKKIYLKKGKSNYYSKTFQYKIYNVKTRMKTRNLQKTQHSRN